MVFIYIYIYIYIYVYICVRSPWLHLFDYSKVKTEILLYIIKNIKILKLLLQ